MTKEQEERERCVKLLEQKLGLYTAVVGGKTSEFNQGFKHALNLIKELK